MFHAYRTDLDRLKRRLSEVTAIAEEADEAAVAAKSRQAAARLQPRRFQVAVVGEFKAGKSTLINAMIAEEVLPVAAQECTAVVCRIRATQEGESPGAEIVVAGGKRHEVAITELRQYLTVAGAMFKGKAVEEAQARLLSAAWLGSDVEIVDTPGVNASGLARERATLEYLPNADAIVFMTRADSLLTDTELIFLRERVLSQDTAKVFVVVNFADRLRSERDRADVMKRASELLPPILGHARLHLVSARDAREAVHDGDRAALDASGLPLFQQALEDFLVRDRAPAELGRHLAVVQGVEGQLTRTLKQRVQTLGLGEELRKRRAERIQELTRLAKSDGDEIVEFIGSECARLKLQVLSGSVSKARARMFDALQELNRRDSDVSESEARTIADRIAGGAHTALQSELRTEACALHGKVAGRISTLFGKLDVELGGGADVEIAAPDYGALVAVNTEQCPDTKTVTRQGPKASEAVGTISAGAMFGAIIGGIFGGPGGAWLGAVIGGGFGTAAALDEKPFTETIKSMIARRRTDATGSAKRFESKLGDHAVKAIAYLDNRTCQDVRDIVRVKQDELRRRMEECDAPVDVESAATVVHLEALLNRLSTSAAVVGSTADKDSRRVEIEG